MSITELKAKQRATSWWKRTPRNLPQGPSKDELRRQLADIAANTPRSADSATAVRIGKGERPCR
jgi:hypothetical protein